MKVKSEDPHHTLLLKLHLFNDDLDEKSNYDQNYDSNDKELDGKDLTDDQYYYNDKETVRAALKMVQDNADLSPNDGNPQGLACLPENINIII